MYPTIIAPQPPNPAEAVRAYQGCRERAEQMLREAQTAEERQYAQWWIDNAERQLTRWLIVLNRQVWP